MITCNGKTRATSRLEKAIIEVGGGSPDRAYTNQELGEVLANAVDIMDEHKPDMLYRLMTTFENRGDIPAGTADGYLVERFGDSPSDGDTIGDKRVTVPVVTDGSASNLD